MWPVDIQDILSRLKNVRSEWVSSLHIKELLDRNLIIIKISSVFGANKRPFIYQEVIDFGNEPIKNTEYSGFARVTEFKYGKKLSEVCRVIISLFYFLKLFWKIN
jgi:hypothetical protein